MNKHDRALELLYNHMDALRAVRRHGKALAVSEAHWADKLLVATQAYYAVELIDHNWLSYYVNIAGDDAMERARCGGRWALEAKKSARRAT